MSKNNIDMSKQLQLGNVIPGFILKLWKMLNDPSCDDLISWTDDGNSFIILDSVRFSNTLSRYFKHNNLSSFIRQLNMYGFRKVATVENCGIAASADDLHFYHPNFIRGKPQLLELIKRKLPQKNGESVDLSLVIKDIEAIEAKQSNVEASLSDLKRENQLLWRELHDLRQRHNQQQMFISNLMKFVLSTLNKDGMKTMLALKRKNAPLAIGGSDDESSGSSSRLKRTKLSNSIEQLLSNQDLITDVDPNLSESVAADTNHDHGDDNNSTTVTTDNPIGILGEEVAQALDANINQIDTNVPDEFDPNADTYDEHEVVSPVLAEKPDLDIQELEAVPLDKDLEVAQGLDLSLSQLDPSPGLIDSTNQPELGVDSNAIDTTIPPGPIDKDILTEQLNQIDDRIDLLHGTILDVEDGLDFTNWLDEIES